jgi:sodium pump decarboxylase gamma subunit
MDLLGAGLRLTVLGMGLVFLLLALLWGLLALLLRADRPAPSPSAPETAAAPKARAKAGPEPLADPTVLAAVVVAVRAHRHLRRKQAAPEFRTNPPGSLPSRWVSTGRTRQNRSWSPGGRYT